MAVEPRADRPGARVLVLAFSDLARDPRVHRQLRFLAPLHQVTAAGWADPQIDGVRFVPLAPRPKPLPRKLLAAVRLLAGRFDAYTWNRSEVLDCRTRLAGIEADVVVANDIDALPVALALFPGARVLFDAHEYAPLEFEDRLFFRVFQQRLRAWQCRTFIPRAAAMTTVCESIAEAYERDTGMRAEIVLNAPDYEPLPPTDTSARGGPPGSIRLVHHGAAIRSRRIEAMIRTLRLLDPRFTLDLYLTGGDTAYFDELRREAGGDERVRFNDPVPMRELPRVLNAYDVGLFLLEPTNRARAPAWDRGRRLPPRDDGERARRARRRRGDALQAGGRRRRARAVGRRGARDDHPDRRPARRGESLRCAGSPASSPPPGARSTRRRWPRRRSCWRTAGRTTSPTWAGATAIRDGSR